ncbi:MAG: 5'-3' exonuclease H3TH domain-containing protein, partial [Planctomycetaceae bacterium]
MPETLYLIDLYSLVFQVFHAIPEMTSPRGLPNNAVFGVTRDLLNLLSQHKPTYLACAADAPGPVERSTWYPEYKAGRSETPPELIPQFPVIREVIGAFGIPYLECPGWEADDIIATWTSQAVARGVEVVIVSNDKDLRQLLGPGVRIYQVRKNAWWGPAELQADWGVAPEQVVDFQALVGDTVDNIPGVPLIGPKKAAALLAQWGTLERVLENAASAPGAKLRENLVTHADQARMSQRLAALRRDLPIATDLAVARTGSWDLGALRDLFQKQGFRRFGDELASLDRDWHGTAGKTPVKTPVNTLGTPAPPRTAASQGAGLWAGDPGPAEAGSNLAPPPGAKGRVQQRLFTTEELSSRDPNPAHPPGPIPQGPGSVTAPGLVDQADEAT